MDNILFEDFNLDQFEMEIELRSNVYREFCESLDFMSSLLDESVILEAVVDPGTEKKKGKKQALGRTAEGIKNTGNVYNNIITANGNVIYAGNKVIGKIIFSMTKVISFISDMLVKLINGIGTIIKLPVTANKALINKIQGNITLYIRAEDIRDIYTTHLLIRLNNLLQLAIDFSQGDTWDGFTGVKNMRIIRKFNPSETDKKIADKINLEYHKINNIEFKKTTIRIKDDEVRNTYFDIDTKSIKFMDLNNKRHEESYYGAMNTLLNDLNSMNTWLKQINSNVCEKFTRGQDSGEFAKLNNKTQTYIIDTVKNIGGTVTIIGNIVKYASADIKSIGDAWTRVKLYEQKLENKKNSASEA